jgi:NADH-quinone oxidoreductase subunit L
MIELALVGAMAVPLLVALAFSVWSSPSERVAARVALSTTALSAAASAFAVALWLAGGARPVHTAPHELFAHRDYRFVFELVLDGASAVFLGLVQFVTGMVMRFSRFYLHREPGFARFFATVLMFEAAMTLLALAGNLDLMFAGWEMVGLSSFLLIAFYRERASAVRNALKTYSVYRVADIGMLLAACLEESGRRTTLGLLLLLAAMGKSAQLPLSFWITRAMEGPTPSSALFYGALSVHAGAYLLLRTFPLWGTLVVVKVCIGLVGAATAVICSMFSRVQPTIKAQIGYASVTQVGLVFVEIALGLTHLALVHVVSNALLRCYQLLVSPSVVAHRLRRQATAGAARGSKGRSLYGRLLPASWRPTLYVFALSEAYWKDAIKVALWFPLRRLGDAVPSRRGVLLLVGVSAGAAGVVLGRSASDREALAIAWALLGIAAAFSACGLGSWRRPTRAFAWVGGSCLLAATAVDVAFGGRAGFEAGVYGVAVALSCAFGLVGLGSAAARGVATRFSGRWAAKPLAASIALVGALGIGGFTLLPTFVGEDLLVHAALAESSPFAFVLAGLLALNGYLALRTFAFTFFGHPDAPEPRAHPGPLPLRSVRARRVGVASP